jgi:hypothetical protein
MQFRSYPVRCGRGETSEAGSLLGMGFDGRDRHAGRSDGMARASTGNATERETAGKSAARRRLPQSDNDRGIVLVWTQREDRNMVSRSRVISRCLQSVCNLGMVNVLAWDHQRRRLDGFIEA